MDNHIVWHVIIGTVNFLIGMYVGIILQEYLSKDKNYINIKRG